MKYFSDPGGSDFGPPYSHPTFHLRTTHESCSISPSNTCPDAYVQEKSHSCLVLKSASSSKPKVTLDLRSRTSMLQTTIVSRPMVRPCIISGSSGLLHESSALGSEYSYAESSSTTGVGLGLGPGPAPTLLINDGYCYGPNCEGNCEKKDEFDLCSASHAHGEEKVIPVSSSYTRTDAGAGVGHLSAASTLAASSHEEGSGVRTRVHRYDPICDCMQSNATSAINDFGEHGLLGRSEDVYSGSISSRLSPSRDTAPRSAQLVSGNSYHLDDAHLSKVKGPSDPSGSLKDNPSDGRYSSSSEIYLHRRQDSRLTYPAHTSNPSADISGGGLDRHNLIRARKRVRFADEIGSESECTQEHSTIGSTNAISEFDYFDNFFARIGRIADGGIIRRQSTSTGGVSVSQLDLKSSSKLQPLLAPQRGQPLPFHSRHLSDVGHPCTSRGDVISKNEQYGHATTSGSTRTSSHSVQIRKRKEPGRRKALRRASHNTQSVSFSVISGPGTLGFVNLNLGNKATV